MFETQVKKTYIPNIQLIYTAPLIFSSEIPKINNDSRIQSTTFSASPTAFKLHDYTRIIVIKNLRNNHEGPRPAHRYY